MTTRHSDLSCKSCRRLKRKCSKHLPACVLCCRVGRECVYPVSTLHADSDAYLASDQAFDQDSANNATSSNISRIPVQLSAFAPRSFGPGSLMVRSFLDSVSMRGSEPPIVGGLLWHQLCGVKEAIATDEAWAIAGRFFNTTYEWLPIVSKVRLYRALSVDTPIHSADVQVLLHAMQLSVMPSSESRSAVYALLKTVIFNLEQYAQFSTNFLSAYALLALHELGQGLFPAAYMTVGNLARIFYSLGFHDRRNATQILRRSGMVFGHGLIAWIVLADARLDTWTETEERRRIWWAVLILDRYVHVGLRFRPLATPNIPADELLPASDEDWDSGSLSINPLLVMSMEAVTFVSPFARACQAAHLLGRVCEHVNQHPSSSDADFHFQEALQISRALRAFLTLLNEESSHTDTHRHKLLAARSLGYAALSILYDVHSCVEPDDVEAVGGHRGLRIDLQEHAIAGFKQVLVDVTRLAEEVEDVCASDDGLQKMPLVVLFPLHTAAGTYAWYARESGAETALAGLGNMKRILKTLGAKWEVASQYLEILDGQEYVYDGADCQ